MGATPHNAVWSILLRLLEELYEIGEIQAINATGKNRITASQNDAHRLNYTFKAVKTTA